MQNALQMNDGRGAEGGMNCGITGKGENGTAKGMDEREKKRGREMLLDVGVWR